MINKLVWTQFLLSFIGIFVSLHQKGWLAKWNVDMITLLVTDRLMYTV